jgi:hypothetical protein
MWRLPRTSGYSYPRVTAIWIDVHYAEENLINTIRTLPTPVHIRPAYASYGQSPYMATFHESSTDLDGSHCSLEKGSRHNPQHARLTDLLIRTQFLSQANQWSSRLKPNFCWWRATRLTRHISLTCDQYVQYLLTEANPSVLNRHRQGATTLKVSAFHIPLFDLSNQRSQLST